jgi:hypothetical protein
VTAENEREARLLPFLQRLLDVDSRFRGHFDALKIDAPVARRRREP